MLLRRPKDEQAEGHTVQKEELATEHQTLLPTLAFTTVTLPRYTLDGLIKSAKIKAIQ